MVLDRLKRLTPAEKAKALARVTCQLFGNILAVLERAAPGKQPDYVVVLRYAVAMAGLQFHSRNIRASNAAEIVELTVPNAARSIAHTLDNEGLIADRNKFFQDFMAEPVREFAASIESLTLNMAMGEDAAARALSSNTLPMRWANPSRSKTTRSRRLSTISALGPGRHPGSS